MRGIILPLAALTAACSAGKTDSSSQANQLTESTASATQGTSACAVLTQGDAEKVLGRPATKLAATGGAAGLDICQYGYQGERMLDMGTASVTVHPVDLGSMKQGVVGEGYKPEPISGIGDQAFWTKEAGLYVGKGNRTGIYIVGIGGATDAQNKDKAIELAKSTVSKL